MSETQQDEGFSHPLTKQKTTYPHNHPLDNSKPPKQTKAEIQQAAREKKKAELAKKAASETQKKQKIIDAKEKHKLITQQIASVEDAVQCSQKDHQSHSECPDLKTMETYQEHLQKQKELEIASEATQKDINGLEDDDSDMYMDPPQFPPESTIDTDSDGAHLGLSKFEDDHDHDDGIYEPTGQEGDEDSDSESDVSEESAMASMHKNGRKQLEKDKKVSLLSFIKLKKANLEPFKHPEKRGTPG